MKNPHFTRAERTAEQVAVDTPSDLPTREDLQNLGRAYLALTPIHMAEVNAREALQSKVESITYDNVIADLQARGARPEAAEYVSDILLVVRKMLR